MADTTAFSGGILKPPPPSLPPPVYTRSIFIRRFIIRGFVTRVGCSAASFRAGFFVRRQSERPRIPGFPAGSTRVNSINNSGHARLYYSDWTNADVSVANVIDQVQARGVD